MAPSQYQRLPVPHPRVPGNLHGAVTSAVIRCAKVSGRTAHRDVAQLGPRRYTGGVEIASSNLAVPTIFDRPKMSVGTVSLLTCLSKSRQWLHGAIGNFPWLLRPRLHGVVSCGNSALILVMVG